MYTYLTYYTLCLFKINTQICKLMPKLSFCFALENTERFKGGDRRIHNSHLCWSLNTNETKIFTLQLVQCNVFSNK